MRVVALVFVLTCFDPMSGAVTCDSDETTTCIVKQQQVPANRPFEIVRTNGVSVTNLNIFKTNMPQLPSTIFISYPNVSVLVLRNNGLKQLEAENFENADKLEALNVLNQPITKITNGTFRSCIGLESLNIWYCQVAEMGANALVGLHNLKALSLHNNLITDLHPKLFASLLQLRVFDVNANRIKTLNSQLFINNPELAYVWFSSNQIEELPQDLFQANERLVKLECSKNLLRSVRTFGFREVYSGFNRIKRLQIDSGLEMLRINGNFLELIECANADLSTINHIYLPNNSLTNFNCIRDMANLTELNVSENKLHRPTQADFTNLTKVNSLEIFDQRRFLKVPAKIFSPMKSIQVLRVDRLVDYRNLRQLFPILSKVWLSTDSWNCSYVQRVAITLGQQKIQMKFNKFQLCKTGKT